MVSGTPVRVCLRRDHLTRRITQMVEIAVDLACPPSGERHEPELGIGGIEETFDGGIHHRVVRTHMSSWGKSGATGRPGNAGKNHARLPAGRRETVVRSTDRRRPLPQRGRHQPGMRPVLRGVQQ